MDLFSQQQQQQPQDAAAIPLAERSRPAGLDGFVGHEAIIGEGTALRESLKHNRLKSLIFWDRPALAKPHWRGRLPTQLTANLSA